MSFAALLNDTASVLVHGHTGAVDSANVPVVGVIGAASYPCRLQQTDATEVLVGRDTLVSTWLLFLPAAAEVQAVDEVIVGERTFRVLGEPAPRKAGGAAVHHWEVRLREVTE